MYKNSIKNVWKDKTLAVICGSNQHQFPSGLIPTIMMY